MAEVLRCKLCVMMRGADAALLSPDVVEARRAAGRAGRRCLKLLERSWRADPYWGVALIFRLLAKYGTERDNTAMFFESKSAVHFFIHEVTAPAVLVREIFTKASRPSREKWVHIQHYFQAFPPRPVTFLK